MAPCTIDASRFRTVLGHFPTGVTVITASWRGQPVGLAIGSFTSASLDPPLVAFLPDKTSSSWPKIRESGAFCVNVLHAGQQHLCRTFATKADDKFAGVSWRPAASGSPLIDGVLAWMDCELQAIHEVGDHDLAIGRVRNLDVGAGEPPLVFFRGRYGRFSELAGGGVLRTGPRNQKTGG